MKAMDWNRHEKNIYDKIIHWFEVIGKVLKDSAILPENVYNMDETGVMLCMLNSVKVLVSKDDRRDYRGAGVKRTTVTAIECISGNGRSLLPMIIWPANTHRSNWTTFPTPGWHYACTESGYTDSKINFEWLKRVFDPQTKGQANQKPRVLISDGFGTHETLEVLEFCFENNITLCRLPSHTTHKLQPCDVGVFAPLKDAYRDEVDRLFRGCVNTIGKEHFTSVYSTAREKAFTKRNITSAWAACGLFPLNPDRVLRKTPKPPSHSTA
jgi:DDE superfamily endonuclease